MLYYLCVYSGKRPDKSDFPGQRHTTGFLGFTQPPILVGGGGGMVGGMAAMHIVQSNVSSRTHQFKTQHHRYKQKD